MCPSEGPFRSSRRKLVKVMNMADNDLIRDAIATAIQMEKDGYSFYTKASAQTSNPSGSKIFESLAKDELLHLETFKRIFANEMDQTEYQQLANSSKKYATLTVFPKDLATKEGANPDTNDLDALHTAMNSEKEAIEYYSTILEKVDNENVAKILKEIIHQEKQHYLILEEEFNYLGKTGYWYDVESLSMEY